MWVLTWQGVLAALVYSSVIGFGWGIGSWIASRVHK